MLFLFELIILAIFQGIGEILPISSSGHLIMIQNLFNIDSENMVIEILLHLASLVALTFYYFDFIKNMIVKVFLYLFKNNKEYYKEWNYFTTIIISSIPTCLIGLILNNYLDKLASYVSILLIFNGFLLLIIRNKDIIRELKEIGFYYLLVGLESISDNYLNSYNKYTGASQNEECINFLNSINLNCMGMLIVDLEFKRKDFTNMYKWIKKTGLKHVALSIFTPLPGSELYKDYEDKLITNDLTKFDYIHLVVKPTNISEKMYYLYYYILVFRLFNLAKKYGIYDFMDWGKLKRDFFTLLTKKK